MFSKSLIASILGFAALAGISPLSAGEYSMFNAPLPYIDPVPNILPVEPMIDPEPGVEPKEPKSDQPSRSILPVEPIMEPERNDVNPVSVLPPPGSAVFGRPQDQIGRRGREVFSPRGRNVVGDGGGQDEPGGGYFPVEPIIIDPPGNIIPVEPSPKPISFPANSKDGVLNQMNRRLVTPIIVPNPLVNQSARISFQPDQRLSGNIQFSIYDLAGNAVVNSNLPARRDGIYQVDLGRLANGIYLLRMSAPGVDAAQKLVVQR